MAQARLGAGTLGALTGAAKLDRVTSLVKQLSEDLKTGSLPTSTRDAALEELKIYGRDPGNADPIFTKEGVATLARHGLYGTSRATSRNAFGCLANAMLLKASTRQLFVDLGLEADMCAKLGSMDLDDEFLISRIIFYTTYHTTIDLTALIERHHLAEIIVENLSRHAKRVCSRPRGSQVGVDPKEDLTLTETLKLLYNVTHFCPAKADEFTPAIAHVVTLLRRQGTTRSKPLDPPVGPLVNAFISLSLDSKEASSALRSEDEPNALEQKLVEIFQAATKSYTDSELDETVSPVVVAINKIFEAAESDAQEFLRSKLLPTADDRRQILGRSENLSSWLLKNSTNPEAPMLRRAIASLLYDMSDKSASKLVQNVGYGYASGILYSNNIPIPADVLDQAGTTDDSENGRSINPVTGQFIDSEAIAEAPTMTQEEKEREAERLFVLFERLKQTGVINIQNPVDAAVQQGRFEELDDDAIEEVD